MILFTSNHDDVTETGVEAALTESRTNGTPPAVASSLCPVGRPESSRPPRGEDDDPDTRRHDMPNVTGVVANAVRMSTVSGNRTQARREPGISDLSCVISSGTDSVSTSSSGAPRTNSVSMEDAANADRTRVRGEARLNDNVAVECQLNAHAITTQRIRAFLSHRWSRKGSTIAGPFEMLENRRAIWSGHGYSTAPRSAAAR